MCKHRFNIIKLDPSELRISESINCENIPDYNIRKLYDNTSNSFNILVIDNAEICEKNISGFIDTLHSKVNIPIILIANKKIELKFYKNCKTIEFFSPSFSDLSNLINNILTDHKINLEKSSCKSSGACIIDKIIKKSQSDLRQIFLILTDLVNNPSLLQKDDWESSYDSINFTDKDIDIDSKIRYILNKNRESLDFVEKHRMCYSDAFSINQKLFQNYPKLTTSIDNSCIVSDLASLNDIMTYNLFNTQQIEFYNFLSSNCASMCNYLNEPEPEFQFQNFKEPRNIENYIKDIDNIRICTLTTLARLNSEEQQIHDISESFSDRLYDNSVHDLVCRNIKKLDNLYKKFKKGINSSKKEKSRLYDLVKNETCCKWLQDFIFKYTLFSYTGEELTPDDIDTRVFKKYISMFNDTKITPFCDYTIKCLICDRLQSYKQNKPKKDIYNIKEIECGIDNLFA